MRFPPLLNSWLAMIKPWERIESRLLSDYAIFKVREDRCRSPRTGQIHSFYIVDAANWVNVIPVTPEGKLVCIRQYRHGSRAVALEIPGGIVESGESVSDAAAREMREETGYCAEEMVSLGAMAPNPAMQSNTCNFYLGRNVRLKGIPSLDRGEDIEVALIDPAEIPTLITCGVIKHGIMVAAFYYYELYRRRRR